MKKSIKSQSTKFGCKDINCKHANLVCITNNNEILQCCLCKTHYSLQELQTQLQNSVKLFNDAKNNLNNQTTMKYGIKLLKDCLELRKTILRAFHRDIAEVEDILSHTYATLGQFTLAAIHSENSLQIIKEIYGEFSIEFGRECSKLAALYFNTKKIKETLDVTERALKILSLFFSTEDDELIELRQIQSYLYKFY